MSNHGECPKCGKRVLHVRVESVVATIDGESRGRCMSYCCIHCNAVLGVQIDHRSKPRPRKAVTQAAE